MILLFHRWDTLVPRKGISIRRLQHIYCPKGREKCTPHSPNRSWPARAQGHPGRLCTDKNAAFETSKSKHHHDHQQHQLLNSQHHQLYQHQKKILVNAFLAKNTWHHPKECNELIITFNIFMYTSCNIQTSSLTSLVYTPANKDSPAWHLHS